ncbi:hypothetical protein YC2023_084373 [Brassica napus]
MHFLLSLDLLENDFGSTTYNADFDDDDINVHFSQDEISRVGACCIVNVKNQYVRPSNEDPLQALIQDTFLDKAESSLLLFSYVSHTICFQRRAVECPAILETRTMEENEEMEKQREMREEGVDTGVSYSEAEIITRCKRDYHKLRGGSPQVSFPDLHYTKPDAYRKEREDNKAKQWIR